MLADALRTDPRRLEPLDPLILEPREWPRTDDDLRHDRVRGLVWRYHPQMLELADDVAASWFQDLCKLVPTPERAEKGLSLDG